MAHVGLHRADEHGTVAPGGLSVLRVDGVQLLPVTCRPQGTVSA